MNNPHAFDARLQAGEIPNLDAYSEETLWAFWGHYRNGRNARELFPAGGRGTRRTTADLANYASNKATAVGLRVKGEIPNAVHYEDICDRIYKGLPESARW